MTQSDSHRAQTGIFLVVPITLFALFVLGGCSREPATSALAPGGGAPAGDPDRSLTVAADLHSPAPPSGIATIQFGGRSMQLWPYTGNSLDGTPSDPVNLLFAGQADPRRLRAALLALDGDRTAFGLPDEYPYNARWSDATGDVHAAWSDGEGWVGSVAQLQLGRYEFGRAHLRLFRTGHGFGDGGTWTVGAAHFEILIPGTADHQVVSWEMARQLVVVDLMRTGLLDAAAPVGETQVISQTPTFREIPAIIYNALPEALRQAIGGPRAPVTSPVGLVSSGTATILHVAGTADPAPGTATDAFTLTYDIVAPKPFCNATGSEYVHLAGPISISKTVTEGAGTLTFASTLSGRLQVTPVDITVSPPAPSGTPYFVNVSDIQSGATSGSTAFVIAAMKRVANGDQGAQILMSRLKVATQGEDRYTVWIKCLGPE